MTVIPCQKNVAFKRKIEDFAEILKTEAHTLGLHGLSERDFYQGGLFRGAIERIRGQFAADMREKREFMRHVLNHMQAGGFILNLESAGDSNRHDYVVTMPSRRISVIELKGCLDGNNTTIFNRPPHAQEFILWSVCTNPGADPQRNVWSGIHTRLSAEIIEKQELVDGVMIWDWLCGTIARPCPKLVGQTVRLTQIGPYQLAPPCIYLFPGTIPSVRNNPSPAPHALNEVELLDAFHQCFGGSEKELSFVRFTVSHHGSETIRKTVVERSGAIVCESKGTPIRRR